MRRRTWRARRAPRRAWRAERVRLGPGTRLEKHGFAADQVAGVTTNAEGRVIKIELNVTNLHGHLPAEFGDLSLLQEVAMGKNHLESLPSAIARQQRLSSVGGALRQSL